MWSMYGDKFEGVRFGMPKNMFEYALSEGSFDIDGVKNFLSSSSIDNVKNILTSSLDNAKSLKKDTIINKEDFKMHSIFDKKDSKPFDINPFFDLLDYCNTFASEDIKYENTIQKKSLINFSKHINWAYEDEFRFDYSAFRFFNIMMDIENNKNVPSTNKEVYFNILRKMIQIPKHIDIKFDTNLIENQKIEIIYGAKMQHGDLHLLELLQANHTNIASPLKKSTINIS